MVIIKTVPKDSVQLITVFLYPRQGESSVWGTHRVDHPKILWTKQMSIMFYCLHMWQDLQINEFSF